MIRIILTLFVTLCVRNLFGQEIKWDLTAPNQISYDITYEVAKKSFIIKKIDDSTYTVKVNKLFHSETYPYSQDFLDDPIGKPNGKLFVSEKKGKAHAILHYYNGKQIRTSTFYHKKNMKFYSTTYDKNSLVIADSSWYENGKLNTVFNRASCLQKSFYEDGKLASEVSINYEKETALCKTYDRNGILLEEKIISDKAYRP